MKNKKLKFILFSVIISLIVMAPYLIQNTLNLEHDTFFHLSRIEGYAQSIKQFDFFPKIYPYKNAGYGYGSSLFYSDIFLLLPAILYNLGCSITVCYKVVLFICSLFSSYTMCLLIDKLTEEKYAPYLAGSLYCFSTYRLTDIYVRGALGEVMAFMFLPLVLIGIYSFINEIDKDTKLYLILGFSGLVLTHNITFLLGCFLFLSFIIAYHKQCLRKERLLLLAQIILITLGITSFFIFPMIEQMIDHQMIVHYYGTSSDLASTALVAWQFFYNDLIFGLAGNNNFQTNMVVNVGWFILIAPIFDWLSNKKENPQDHFISTSLFVGLFFMFLCSNILPWKYLTFLSVIQFPFRFMTIALVLLVIPASIGLTRFFSKYRTTTFTISMILILANFAWMIQPVFTRTFVMSDNQPYSDITSGMIIDPYYSASYMRVELAGGDYLPLYSIDYRALAPCVRTTNQQIVTCLVEQKYDSISFEVNETSSVLLLPITYYKGYQAYNSQSKINTSLNKETGLVQIQQEHLSGSITLKYTGTLIQKISMGISFLTLIYIIINHRKQRSL